MRYYVLGNWKSNGDAVMWRDFTGAFENSPCPESLACGIGLPFHLLHLGKQLSPGWIGAQNVSAFGEGAYTGEITAGMLQECGVRFCLVGHSERRQYFGEAVEATAAKLGRLLSTGILPIFCIGESLQEREQGLLEEILAGQLVPLRGIARDAELVIAYEPVWAIGTGVAAEPEDVAQAHQLIKNQLAELGFDETPVLYGGSVKPGNAETLAAIEGVDGFLVGGASLRARDFNGITAGFTKGKALV